MPTISPCTIQYDNPAATYHPGDLVSGSLLLGFLEPTKVRKIFVQIVGHCITSFSKGTGDNKRHYHACETYFQHRIFVYGDERSEETIHPAGPANYRFQVALPTDLPPSYQGYHGRIEYYCDAQLDLPWAFDKEIKIPFVVAKTVDLNMEAPAVRMPKIKEYTSKAGCCFGACCSWGSVKSTLQLQRGAFIPGEAIHFIADIANRSSKMCSVEVSLVEVVKFRARAEIKLSMNAIVAFRKEIPSETDDVMEGQLVVPANATVVKLDKCSLINHHYVVRLQANITLGLIQTLEEEIILGHIPLAGNQ